MGSRNNSQNREAVRKSKEGSGTAAVSAITTEGADTSGAEVMGEADMYLDSDNSSLEYVPGVEYGDYGSCSIGHFTMGQFDGMAEDDNTDNEVSSDEGGEPEKTPEASYSSTDSDDIIDMVVEAATEDIYEKCSGNGEHSNCWPHECIITTSTSQAAPRDTL